MSLQKYLPANLYLHSDSNAPKSAKVADNFSTLLKACLVTGYGDKPAAGWTLLFEDTSKNTKVFRSPALTERSFDVHVVDNGTSATVQVCFDMTSIDDFSNFKLRCATPFKNNVAVPTGRWTLIATSRGFWFFNELRHDNTSPHNQSGTYIFCGDTCADSMGRKALYLKHSGGTWGDADDDREHIFYSSENGGVTSGVLYDFAQNTAVVANPSAAFFNGTENITKNTVASQVVVLANSNIWRLPAYAPSRIDKINYDMMIIDGLSLINHGTSTRQPTNFLIPTNWWDM